MRDLQAVSQALSSGRPAQHVPSSGGSSKASGNQTKTTSLTSLSSPRMVAAKHSDIGAGGWEGKGTLCSTVNPLSLPVLPDHTLLYK